MVKIILKKCMLAILINIKIPQANSMPWKNSPSKWLKALRGVEIWWVNSSRVDKAITHKHFCKSIIRAIEEQLTSAIASWKRNQERHKTTWLEGRGCDEKWSRCITYT